MGRVLRYPPREREGRIWMKSSQSIVHGPETKRGGQFWVCPVFFYARTVWHNIKIGTMTHESEGKVSTWTRDNQGLLSLHTNNFAGSAAWGEVCAHWESFYFRCVLIGRYSISDIIFCIKDIRINQICPQCFELRCSHTGIQSNHLVN